MGHVGHDQLKQLSRIVDGMNVNNNDTETVVNKLECLITRVKASRPLERIHSDVVGPIDTVSYNGNRYILTLLDDYTHFSTATLPLYLSDRWLNGPQSQSGCCGEGISSPSGICSL
jgi:hypothetical protein